MYEEEIARSLADISEQIRENKSKTPTFYTPIPKTMASSQGIQIQDSTVIKFGMIVAIMVLGYLIIQSASKKK